MKSILIIGNSFGTDCARYLNGISRAGGAELRVVNLFIGGCSLYRHYRNMLSGDAAYDYEINGNKTGLKISLPSALVLEEWDYIVMQQCSPESGEYEKYQPFLSELAAYVRRFSPRSRLCINMTWTFDRECTRFHKTPFETPEEMMPAIRDAYHRAARDVDADVLFPTGEAVWKLYHEIGAETYRDGFHANLGWTRYMLGAVWFMVLTRRSILGNRFCDFDIDVPAERLALVQKIAHETVVEAGFELKEKA